MKGTVSIVQCVDTEGPLYESLESTFERIKEAFDIELKPTEKVLEKLRNKEIELNGKEEVVCDFVSRKRLNYNDTWDKIYQMLHIAFSDDFRYQILDSYGGGYCFNWFCIDHVGFRYNPRRRAGGYHVIFEEYARLLKAYNCKTDRIYWHFHPKGFSQDAHRTGDNHSFSNLHNEILARRIIDHQWFPVANRPTTSEHMDYNLWLEQWIPFDFANMNMMNNNGLESQTAAGRVPGRVADWRGAPTDWTIYHPSVWDSRRIGGLRRYIARCLYMNCRHSTITEEELNNAFLSANEGKNILVSVTNHDFRDMVAETKGFIALTRKVAAKYPKVKYKWSNAVEAMRHVLELTKEPPPVLSCKIDKNLLYVTSNKPLWGPQPFLAIRTSEGNYYHDNFIINSETDWTYVFDKDSILLDMVSKIGIASNDTVGNTIVTVCDLDTPDNWKINYLNIDDWIDDKIISV